MAWKVGFSASSYFCRCGAAYSVILCLLLGCNLCNGGLTSSYVRRLEESTDMPLDSDVFKVPPGYNAPQQVHIIQGDHVGKAMLVSWVTPDEPGSSQVVYWSSSDVRPRKAKGIITRYKYYNYTSGYIHHCNLTNLKHDTTYHYKVGKGKCARTFKFTTPPEVGPDVPYTFGLIGDLGQTYDSNVTLTHYENNPKKGQTVLFVGDVSYADKYPFHDNTRWDTWGRFAERNTAYQSWILTAGNHDIDYEPDIGEHEPFKPFLHRFHVPYEASGSDNPLWYSVKIASAHIIVLSSYSACGKYTPQYIWLKQELKKVNRSETPWLMVLLHAPLYNSNYYHYMEGETMKVVYESWFVDYKVDVVFAGHVHAYERSERVSNVKYNITNALCATVRDENAPVYINIGDGGNIEGLANNVTEPQPDYSAFRELSYGHAIFDIKNRTHAYFSWHRNQDGYAVEADRMWFYNRYWNLKDDSTTTS